MPTNLPEGFRGSKGPEADDDEWTEAFDIDGDEYRPQKEGRWRRFGGFLRRAFASKMLMTAAFCALSYGLVIWANSDNANRVQHVNVDGHLPTVRFVAVAPPTLYRLPTAAQAASANAFQVPTAWNAILSQNGVSLDTVPMPVPPGAVNQRFTISKYGDKLLSSVATGRAINAFRSIDAFGPPHASWSVADGLPQGRVAALKIVSTSPGNFAEAAAMQAGIPSARVEVRMEGDKAKTVSRYALFDVSVDANGTLVDVQSGSYGLFVEVLVAALVLWLGHGFGRILYAMSDNHYDYDLREKLSGYGALTATLLLFPIDNRYGLNHQTVDQAMMILALLTLGRDSVARTRAFLWLLSAYAFYKLATTPIVEPAAELRKFYGPMGILQLDMILLGTGAAILAVGALYRRADRTTHITTAAGPLVQDVRIVENSTRR